MADPSCPCSPGSNLPGATRFFWRATTTGFEDKDYVPPDFKAIRTSDERTYVEYGTGERELYDLRTDPRQLRSLHEEPERAVEVKALSARLQALKYCSGKGCRCAEQTATSRPSCPLYPSWRGLSHVAPLSGMKLSVVPGEALLHMSVGGASGIKILTDISAKERD